MSAPADKRFRRAHVKPTRSRPWYGSWWRVAMVAGACAGAAVAAALVVRTATTTPLLRIGTITVTGNHRVSTKDVRALLAGLVGQNMLQVDLKAWQQKLVESPWVATAEIRRRFPGSVSVALSERRPMAIAGIGGTLHLVDETGTIIARYGPEYAELDLPLIDGFKPAPGGLMVDEERAALAAGLLASVEPRSDLASRLSEIDVTDTSDVVVLLRDDPSLVHLGHDRFAERLDAYVELASALRERVLDIDYVDLRYEGQVIVRPVAARPPRRGKG